MHFNEFAPISGQISSQICIKKVLQSCLQHTKRWSVACPLRIHFLHSHFEFFPENLGAVNDEQGEIFHKDIQAMEERYKGVWNEGMRMVIIAGCCTMMIETIHTNRNCCQTF